MSQKKLASMLIALALVVSACGSGAATPASDVPPVVVDDFAVIADGRLLPSQFVQLSFANPGRVAQLLRAEGEPVAQDEVIARLENSEALAADVARSELERLNAQ